jgi:hypothetical protein
VPSLLIGSLFEVLSAVLGNDATILLPEWNFRQILASLKIEVQRFLKINFGGTEISE